MVDFSQANLNRAQLSGAHLCGANLRGTNLSEFEADLSGTDLSKAILHKAKLNGADLGAADLNSTDFSETFLTGADLSDVDLSQAKLSGVDLSGVNFSGFTLIGANLSEANLRGANLCGVNLTEADLQKAKLSNAKLSQANLSKADLQNANLAEANLTCAILQEAILTGAILQKANLGGADLTEAQLNKTDLANADFKRANLTNADLSGKTDLNGADFRKAKVNNTLFCEYINGNYGASACLKNADFREAELRNVDLTNVSDFSIENIAGADVLNLTLPKTVKKDKFEALEMVAETSKNARNLFHLMLLGCLYSWITIATTTDVNLLTDSATSPLPVINAAIPIVKFYWAAPLFLLGFYVYFHLYSQRMWEELSFQPAIFPDGKRLDRKAYPWLLNVFTNLHFTLLKKNRSAQIFLKVFFSWLLGWWSVPITLGYFDWRCLTRHDRTLTYMHLILLVLSILLMFRSYSLATATLWEKKRVKWKETFAKRNICHVLLMFGVVLGILLVLGMISFVYSKPLSDFSLIKWRPANFIEADVSIKHDNWTGSDEEIPLIKGAKLQNSNLENVQANGAFLIKADLRNATLINANLVNADLRSANLEGANLVRANLKQATFKNTKTNLTVEELKRRGAIVIEEGKK
jgi:uncharacterized protein YjbI with pentapeptide repeats